MSHDCLAVSTGALSKLADVKIGHEGLSRINFYPFSNTGCVPAAETGGRSDRSVRDLFTDESVRDVIVRERGDEIVDDDMSQDRFRLSHASLYQRSGA